MRTQTTTNPLSGSDEAVEALSPEAVEALLKDTLGKERMSVEIGKPIKDCKAEGNNASYYTGALIGSKLYAFPADADQIVCLDTANEKWTMVGPEKMAPDASGQKYGCTIAGSDGKIYGIPSCAEKVAVFDPQTQEVVYLEYADNRPEWGSSGGSSGLKMPWKWHTAVESNGLIFGIPLGANQVLCIDPQTATAKLIGGELGGGDSKWMGGVRAPNGVVYGIPWGAQRLLRIDPETMDVSVVGRELQITHGEKWSGGCLGPDGKIYGFPFTAKKVMCYDPADGDESERQIQLIGEDLRDTADASRQGRYAGPGGTTGSRIIVAPSCSSRALCIETSSSPAAVFEIGEDLGDGLYKWIGCTQIPETGAVYAFPHYQASRCLKISPPADMKSYVEAGTWKDGVAASVRTPKAATCAPAGVGGGVGPQTQQIPRPSTLFGGAVCAENGRIICVPEEGEDKFLCIEPDGTCRLFGDVKIETKGGSGKYRGCVLGGNGKVYGIPACAKQVVEVCPETLDVRLFGADLADNIPGNYCWNWWGGCVDKGGNIWCGTDRSKALLKIDTKLETATRVTPEMGTPAGMSNDKTEVNFHCSASAGCNGMIYFPPVGRALFDNTHSHAFFSPALVTVLRRRGGGHASGF
jgi:hypothetical protein